MNDYQRGLLRAAEICVRINAMFREDTLVEAATRCCADTIRAEAEKSADGQAGHEPIYTDGVPLSAHPAPSQESHAAGPACSAPDSEQLLLSRLTNKWQEFYDVADTGPLQRVLKSMVQREIVDARPNIDASADVRLKPTSKAPDEALIEEIVDNAVEQYKVFKGREEDALVFLATLTIREYIRRSAGKEKG